MNRFRALAPLAALACAAPLRWGGDLPATAQAAGTQAAATSRPFRLSERVARSVARVGSKEITTGEILEAAKTFFPAVLEELDSPYGEQFLDSYVFDDWVDAYVDLCVLRRDPRVTSLMPTPTMLERGIAERARLLAVPAGDDAPASRPEPSTAGLSVAMEKARRFFGFDVARQIQLDALVPPETDATELRRLLIADPWKVNVKIRARHLLLPTRGEPNEKRFDRARRENVRADADRVIARLRAGEPFAEVSAQVRGPHAEKPKDTLPWISYEANLPMPVLRALFAGQKGDYVGPVEIREGYSISFIEDRTIVPGGDFEKVRDRFARIVRRDSQYDLLLKLRGEVVVLVY